MFKKCKIPFLLAALQLSISNIAATTGSVLFDYESLGLADGQSIASGTVISSGGVDMTMTWSGDSGFSDSEVSYNDDTWGGISANNLHLAIDSPDLDPSKVLTVETEFSGPLTNLCFSVLSVDTGLFDYSVIITGGTFRWADEVEVYVTGVGFGETNVRDLPSSVFSLGSLVRLDDESDLNGFEGGIRTVGSSSDGNIDFDFGSLAITKVRVVYRAGDDAYGYPLQDSSGVATTDPQVQLIGLSEFSGSVATTPPTPAAPAPLANLSTRGHIGTGDDVLIGGVIIQGTGQKKVLITGRGQSIAASVPGRISNPKLDLFSGSTVIQSSDDWSTEGQVPEINSSGNAPGDPSDAAVVATLNPGAYTVIVSGVGGATGVGIVEIYDLEHGSSAEIVNLSTRGRVGTGDNVLIGGLIVGGDATQSVSVAARGTGPSSPAGTLLDPEFTVFSGPTPVLSNDDWGTAPGAGLLGGFQPGSPVEPAAILNLSGSSSRTVILSGVGATEGIALIEFFVR